MISFLNRSLRGLGANGLIKNLVLQKTMYMRNYNLYSQTQPPIHWILSNYKTQTQSPDPFLAIRNFLALRQIYSSELKTNTQSQFQNIKITPQFKNLLKNIKQNFTTLQFNNIARILYFLKELNIQPQFCQELKKLILLKVQKIDLIKLSIFIKEFTSMNLQPQQTKIVYQRLQYLISEIERKFGVIQIKQANYKRPNFNEKDQKSKKNVEQLLNIMIDKQYSFLVRGISHNSFKNSDLLIRVITLGITQKNIKTFDFIILANIFRTAVSSLGQQDFKSLQQPMSLIFNRIVLECDINRINELQPIFRRDIFESLGRYCYVFKKQNAKLQHKEKDQVQEKVSQNQMIKKGQELLYKLILLSLKEKNLLKKVFWSTSIQVFGRLKKFDQKLWNQILQQAFKTTPTVKELQFLSIGITALPVKQRLLIKSYEDKLWQFVWKSFPLMKQRQQLKFIQICIRSKEKGIQINIPQSIKVKQFNQLLELRKNGKPIKSVKK